MTAPRHRAIVVLLAGIFAAICPWPVADHRSPSEEFGMRFDRMDRRINSGQGYSTSLNTNGELAWGEGYILRGYMEMFKATGDTVYLDDLIEHFDRVLRSRDDVRKVRD